MLRRLLVVCLFLSCGLLSASTAQADDLFTYVVGSNTYTWMLPSSPTIPSGDFTLGSDFKIFDVMYWINGVPQTATNDEFEFFNFSSMDGGFELVSSLGAPVLDTFTAQVYGGSEEFPTFSPGTFMLNNGGTMGPVETLTISGPAGAATPEPASLLLFGSGALVLAIAIRLRRKTAAQS